VAQAARHLSVASMARSVFINDARFADTMDFGVEVNPVLSE
jgi:hypothetical protein